MGLLDKVKNIFTEEVEVEEKPVKKEVIKVEIPAPVNNKTTNKKSLEDEILRKEIIKKEALKKELEQEKMNIKEEIQLEEKNTAPVFFDDKDFATLEKPRIKQEDKKRPLREKYKGGKTPVKEEKKKFKPTPIISPVYGILDKNYSKNDIETKSRTNGTYSEKKVTIDDIRKKAYGTLEDELETSLIINEEETKNPEYKEPSPEEMFEELIGPDEVNTAFTKDEANNMVDTEQKEDIFDFDIDDLVKEDKKEAEQEQTQDLTESDLFNLIDSMYEKGDKE